MATRLYGRENGTAPGTPAVDGGWESSASPFARSPAYTSTDSGDTLTTVSGFGSTSGQDRCHRQWISLPMSAGLVFNTSVTYKAYAQVLESAANDNIRSRLCVRILSEDLSTVRHTVLAIADYSTAAEWNTALRNKAFADGDAGTGSYTTVAGDRLVLEWGHNDSSGVSISGSSRWGSAGTADLGENETSTSTSERPWFETSLNLTFVGAALASSVTAAVTTGAALTTQITLEGAASGTASAAAALTTAITLAVAPVLAVSVAGDLTTQITMQGAATAAVAATGTLTGPAAALEAGVTLAATASADLTTAIALAAAPELAVATAGDLTTAIRMAAVASLSAAVSAGLTTAISLQGAVTLAGAAQGDFSTEIRLAAGAGLTASTAGDLSTQIQMAAAVPLTVSAAADLVTEIRLASGAVLILTAIGELADQSQSMASAAVLELLAGGTLTTPATPADFPKMPGPLRLSGVTRQTLRLVSGALGWRR